MAFDFATGRTAIGTSTGNKDLTSSAFGGGTPDAHIVLMSSAIADATEADDLVLSIGFSDGTRTFNMNTNDESGQSTTDGQVSGSNTDLLRFMFPGTANEDGAATFDSSITNGVRVDIDNAFGASYLTQHMHFGGSDWSGYVNTFTGGQKDVDIDVTTVGFEPDFVVFAYVDRDAGVTGNDCKLSLGIAWNNGGTFVQRSIATYVDTGQSPSETEGEYRTDYIGGKAGASSPKFELSDPDSSGFTITPRVLGSEDGMYFAGKVANHSLWMGDITTPDGTDPGDDYSVTGVGHAPLMFLALLSQHTAANTLETGGKAFPVAFHANDGTNEFTTHWRSENDANPTVCKCRSDDSVVLTNDTGTVIYSGTHTSMDSNGWSWNFPTASATAHKWFALSIGTTGVDKGDQDDVGGGSDALQPVVSSIVISDTGQGLESEVEIAAPQFDTASGSDEISVITAAFATADTGAGAEVTVPVGSALAIADAGTQSPDIVLGAGLAVADSNSIVEAINISEEGVPPTFTVAPTAEDVLFKTFDIRQTMDQDGTVYAVVMSDGDTAPTSLEVKNANPAAGTMHADESVAVSAGISGVLVFTDLAIDTLYDVYVVGDSTNGLMATPVKVDVETSSTTKSLGYGALGIDGLGSADLQG